MSKKILIVDAEKEFALRMAAVLKVEGHHPHIVGTAAEAVAALQRRGADLAIVRAELPDESGFGLCSRMQRELGLKIPTVLVSSASTAEALEDHATSSPNPADAYLRIPFALEALVAVVRRIAGVTAAMPPPIPPPIPPAAKRRATPAGATKERLGADDWAFAERVFASVSHRTVEAPSEAFGPPAAREGVHTPDGRVRLLRDEVRSREAQIARLAGLWGALERQLGAAEDARQALEVELAGVRLRLEAAERKAADALHLASQREREHGESVNQLLLERFAQEKDLIEVVAAKEREIGLLKRELSKREEEEEKIRERLGLMEELESLLSQARERILADAERMSVLEEELATMRNDRERVEAALLAEIEELRAGAARAADDDPLELTPVGTAEWVLPTGGAAQEGEAPQAAESPQVAPGATETLDVPGLDEARETHAAHEAPEMPERVEMTEAPEGTVVLDVPMAPEGRSSAEAAALEEVDVDELVESALGVWKEGG